MTPPEVVDFMVDILIDDLKNDSESPINLGQKLTLLDPTCGVGSFLTAFYHRVRTNKLMDLNDLHLFGQDKVERMARLATINLELFDVGEHRITVGNSLERGSTLDDLNGKVDVILTNPPFGARFSGDEVRATCRDNTPFFSSIMKAAPSIDSELLFIDRNLRLLKEGGRLLIVVPDGVVSAKGTSALLRQHVGGVATIQAIVEMPSVTFAQAGTRTKTAVLYFQKQRTKKAGRIFMAVAQDLGFQVSSRKGVQIKQAEGENQLPRILSAYTANRSERTNHPGAEVVLRNPSCVTVPEDEVLRGSWTPNHYSAGRFDAISAVHPTDGLQMVPLRELVEFCSETRRTEKWKPGTTFLSILHVLGEGLIDMAGAQEYAPKTPGIPTHPGEILLSRINPRIPRVGITPDFGTRTLCSMEFVVMRPTDRIDPFLLTYLLLSKTVQQQICSLTSGTSASHNRIRTSELASVLIPVPTKGSEKYAQFEVLAEEYRLAISGLAHSAAKVASLRMSEAKFFGPN
jgi:predicted RNA methylase